MSVVTRFYWFASNLKLVLWCENGEKTRITYSKLMEWVREEGKILLIGKLVERDGREEAGDRQVQHAFLFLIWWAWEIPQLISSDSLRYSVDTCSLFSLVHRSDSWNFFLQLMFSMIIPVRRHWTFSQVSSSSLMCNPPTWTCHFS